MKHKPLILYADDNVNILEAWKELLRRNGYEITHFAQKQGNTLSTRPLLFTPLHHSWAIDVAAKQA